MTRRDTAGIIEIATLPTRAKIEVSLPIIEAIATSEARIPEVIMTQIRNHRRIDEEEMVEEMILAAIITTINHQILIIAIPATLCLKRGQF